MHDWDFTSRPVTAGDEAGIRTRLRAGIIYQKKCLRISRCLPQFALVCIALVLTIAIVSSRNLALQKSAIYIPSEPADAHIVLEIDIHHPSGFFQKEKLYLRQVEKLTDEFFFTGHFGQGIGGDGTQTICCGQSIDFKTAAPGKIRLQVFAYCIAHPSDAQPDTPPLINDALDHVIVNVPAFGASVQQLGKFTISSKIVRVDKKALNRSRR